MIFERPLGRSWRVVTVREPEDVGWMQAFTAWTGPVF